MFKSLKGTMMSKLLSALIATAFAATLSFNAVAADSTPATSDAKAAPAKKHMKKHHKARKHHKAKKETAPAGQ